ncbi:hypothetical protein V8F06_000835 [Rhypophila decipiens]
MECELALAGLVDGILYRGVFSGSFGRIIILQLLLYDHIAGWLIVCLYGFLGRAFLPTKKLGIVFDFHSALLLHGLRNIFSMVFFFLFLASILSSIIRLLTYHTISLTFL